MGRYRIRKEKKSKRERVRDWGKASAEAKEWRKRNCGQFYLTERKK